MGLAAAEAGCRGGRSRPAAPPVGEPQEYLVQELTQTAGGVGVGEEPSGVLVVGRRLAAQHRGEIGGQIGIDEPTSRTSSRGSQTSNNKRSTIYPVTKRLPRSADDGCMERTVKLRGVGVPSFSRRARANASGRRRLSASALLQASFMPNAARRQPDDRATASGGLALERPPKRQVSGSVAADPTLCLADRG